MENPLADICSSNRDYQDRRRKTMSVCIMSQTSLTLVQLHSRETLKNKKKLAIAIKEIRDFADTLENFKI